MVDSDTFINTNQDGNLTSINFGDLVSRLLSSYVLASFAGIASVVYAVFKVPADLIDDFLTWTAESLGLGFTVPADSIEGSWDVVLEFFPVTGLFDWLIGVLLVIAFFAAVGWMFQRVRGGL